MTRFTEDEYKLFTEDDYKLIKIIAEAVANNIELTVDDAMTFVNDAPFKEWHGYMYCGSLCLSAVMLLGPWLSLGLHVSIKPAYVELHILWFILCLQSRTRGEYQEMNDNDWKVMNT